MMKKVLIGLGILAAIVAVLGLIAPAEFTIEREIVINKPKDAVFNRLKMIKDHGNWSPFERRDPNIVMEYKGTDGTVGFITAWSGNNEVGKGEQEITAIDEGNRIDLDLRFKEPFENTGTATFTTEAVGENATKVKWAMKGKSKFPFSIFCMIIGMDKMLGKDFEDGLAMMKTHFEK